MMPIYLQPIAQHCIYPERLVLRGEDDRLYLWLGGDGSTQPQPTATEVVNWLIERHRVVLTPTPVWFHTDDLPLGPQPVTATNIL